ncbi:DUF3365 domain-containing protein [Thalassomonas sp. M1454]|uniref:Tll0287-like domain-containing protein n=1 Tax=Thalassomonas sp. M1454 TaxID=2594477 RepID=UPI00117E914C|nr:DUF3365 domain-containing protein [Thalassomonas sp. M1454]TRX56621.1 DUF3365 domain-containing protein [Thalassomonas sp. M1454]
MNNQLQYNAAIGLVVLSVFTSVAYGENNSQHESSLEPISEYRQEAQNKIKIFAGQLKGQLQQAIKAGGLTSAIDVCKIQAPLIANSLSIDGWQVARTSLKVRNEDNIADQWEQETLVKLADRKANGESFKQLTQEQLTTTDYRFMQAIGTAEICLACHGKNIDKNVLQHINQQYPNDQAVGFSKGDIRGAFTLSKRL